MPVIELNPPKYSDATIVEGVYQHSQKMGYALYKLCRDYYEEYFHAVFFIDEESSKDIFQNSLVTLLEKIESRKIYVENNVLIGKDGKPFTSKLTSYFMGIAILKYKEWVRDWNGKGKKVDVSEAEQYREILYDDDENPMLRIVSDCISKMPRRCNQVLTLFYYREKKLDEILKEIDSYESKNALKTEKYRCMKNLRESATAIYHRFFN